MKPGQTVTNEYGTFEAVEYDPDKVDNSCIDCAGKTVFDDTGRYPICYLLPVCFNEPIIFKQIHSTTENPRPE